MNTLAPHRRFIVTGCLIFLSLTFIGFFEVSQSVSPVFQSVVVSATFFLVIPFLYCKMVLREPLGHLGWQRGKAAAGIVSGLFCVGVALVLLFFLIRFTSFKAGYQLPVGVENNFAWFIFYELVIVSFTALLYEVFFRGLVQMLWLRNSPLSVIAQTLLFVLLLYFSSDLTWQKVPLLMFAPLSGLIAYASQSLWYSLGWSWAFFFLSDIVLLVWR